MVLEYFSLRKGKGPAPKEEKSDKPVLNGEEERFLHEVASSAPPPLPARSTVILDDGHVVRGKDAQVALMDGAEQVPLPTSPPELVEGDEEGEQESSTRKKRRSFASFLPSISGRASRKADGKHRAADVLHEAAEAANRTDDSKANKQDEEDLTAVLDQLNLAAVNNRVFSFSNESQELMDKFKLVLKDIVTGVPTAYDDLEKLLTNSEGQLQRMFGDMPPWLQTLVKGLPAKMAGSFGSELMAAAGEKPELNVNAAEEEAESNKLKPDGSRKNKKKRRIPSLRRMVSQQGAVASMLQSILHFLKLRFPIALAGTNVLMSVSIFLLLFVFWYLHKRGRETRLAREAAGNQASSDIEASDVEESVVLEKDGVVEAARSGVANQPSIEGTGRFSGEGDPAAQDHSSPNERLADLPSVRDLPDPKPLSMPQ